MQIPLRHIAAIDPEQNPTPTAQDILDTLGSYPEHRAQQAADALRDVANGVYDMRAINEAAYTFGLKYEPAEEPRKAMVYLAGPLTKGDQQENAARAMRTAGWLMREADRIGLPLAVFVPHAYLAADAEFPRNYEAWMATTDIVLSRCDALFRISGESPGSDREEARAAEQGIPVFKHSIAAATQMLAFLRSKPATLPR